MEEHEVIDIIFGALRKADDNRINDVTRDGDHKSVEIVLTTDDGEKKQAWVISSRAIKEVEATE